MKAGLLNVMQAFGVFAPFRFANRSKALILTYHRFGELRALTIDDGYLDAYELSVPYFKQDLF